MDISIGWLTNVTLHKFDIYNYNWTQCNVRNVLSAAVQNRAVARTSMLWLTYDLAVVLYPLVTKLCCCNCRWLFAFAYKVNKLPVMRYSFSRSAHYAHTWYGYICYIHNISWTMDSIGSVAYSLIQSIQLLCNINMYQCHDKW